MKINNIVRLLILFGRASSFEFASDASISLSACESVLQITGTWCEPISEYAYYNSMSCMCSNKYSFETLVGCLDIVGDITNDLIEQFKSACSSSNLTITADSFQEALTNYYRSGKNSTQINTFNVSEIVEYPILIDTTHALKAKESYNQYYQNTNRGVYYGIGIIAYWGVVLLLFGLFNWIQIYFPRFSSRFSGYKSNFIRKYITLPALVERRKAQEKTIFRFLSFLIPSRLESLIIFIFSILVLVFCSVHMNSIENNTLFTSKGVELTRYAGDRTGFIGTCIVPLMILFAGRNNFLQWCTGLHYSTFILYHRWIGRVVFILLFIHAVSYTINFDLSGYYGEEVKEKYMVWGIIAVVANGVILFQGLLYLRRKWYEVFLVIHIILAALFVAGYWIHLGALGDIQFAYCVAAVWIFDRVIRFCKLISFGFPEVEIKLLEDETIKVIIPKPSYWKISPGGHVFIHFLHPVYFWQSHPFTYVTSNKSDSEIILFCKVKNGITKLLYKKLLVAPNRTIRMSVAVEGPYGKTTAARKSNTAVFFAGGIGITGLYCEALYLAKTKDKNCQRRIKLFWVVRDYSSIIAFQDELNELKHYDIETFIYITRPTNNNEDTYNNKKKLDYKYSDESSKENSELEQESNIKNNFSHVSFIESRPNIHETLSKEIRDANISISFVTCGAPAMMDDIRYSIATLLDDTTSKRVDLFETLQIWT